jgi:hypothetical protein
LIQLCLRSLRDNLCLHLLLRGEPDALVEVAATTDGADSARRLGLWQAVSRSSALLGSFTRFS